MEYFVPLSPSSEFIDVFSCRILEPCHIKHEVLYNNSQQQFPAISSSFLKELHLRCCIGLELNIAEYCNMIQENSKRIGGTLMIETFGKYQKFTLLDALKIHFQRFFALRFLHLISYGRLNRVITN